MFEYYLSPMFAQKNSCWEESISLSKQDKQYKYAMITAAAVASTEVAEEPIR